MRIVFGVILLFVYVSTAVAQSSTERQIQQVKNDSGYIWVEERESTQEEAYEKAVESLRETVQRQYKGALSSATGITDAQTRLQQRRTQLPYQSIVVEERRRTTVFLYMNNLEAERYIQQYATAAYRTDEYISGEATGPNREAAINAAQQNLISQMIVQVFSEQEMRVEEVDLEVSEEFRSQARAVSQMQLINARREAFPIGDQYYAMVYMTIEDKNESFDLIKNQAISSVDEGNRFMNLGMPSRAIENYYRAYLLSSNYNRSIEYELDGEMESNLRSALRLKVENYLYTMDIDISPAYEHSRRTIEIPVDVRHSGEWVDGAVFEYQIGQDRIRDQVRHGQATIQAINYFPERRIEIVPVDIWLDISNITERDEMLAALEEAHKIQVTRNLEVNYSNVLRPSIQAHVDGATVYFSLHSPFLTATTAVWEFGDGETTRGLSAEHTYNVQDEFEVRVVVNNDEELSDTKFVNLYTGIVHNRPSMIEQAPELRRMSDHLADNRGGPSGESPEPYSEPSAEEEDTQEEETEDVEPLEPEPEEEPISESKEEEALSREEIFAELTGFQTFRGLVQKVQHMQRQELIEFGNRDDFHNLEGALVVVSDPNQIRDYLFFRNNRYMKVDTGEEVIDLAEKYEGMYQIWIQTK